MPTVYKKIVREEEVIDEVCCNKCGESCTIHICNDSNGNSIKDHFGLIDCTVSGGYDSPHLTDLTYYNFSLCEKCLVELFETFKIPVTVTDRF